jgi:DNA-binding transcriptional ArsR family regulator
MLEIFTAVGRAVADPTRVRILKMLQYGELCVCQITAILGLSSATVSKHLSLLKMAGLASQRKEGRWVFYRLAPYELNPYAPHMLSVLSDVLDDDPGVARDRDRLDQINTVSAEVLCRMGPNPLGADGRIDAALLDAATRGPATKGGTARRA